MSLADINYKQFKVQFERGLNTYTRIKNFFDLESEEEFNYYYNLYKKESFIDTLFTDSIKFSKVINYNRYLNEDVAHNNA